MSSGKAGAYGLTPRARADLEEIWRYTAEQWSVEQADAYVGALADSFALIASMPAMARERAEFTPPVRIHVHEMQLIVCVIEDGGVSILRVLGGRQDWLAILNDAEP